MRQFLPGIILSFVGVFFSITTFSQSQSETQFNKGFTLFKNSEFKSALRSFETADSLGNSKAKFFIGMFYMYGYGVSIDYVLARKKLVEAYSEYAPAGYYLGTIYKNGYGIPVDTVTANKYYSTSFKLSKNLADAGDLHAIFVVSKQYEEGLGTIKNEEQAFKYISGATESKYHLSLTLLGVYYQSGIGTKKNYWLALNYYQKAMEYHWPRAYCNKAYMYLNGDGVVKDTAKALELFAIAESYDFVPALETVADFYFYNDIPDYHKALKYYFLAAELNSSYAQRRIGFMYSEGMGVNKNIDSAMFYCNKAAEENNLSAINSIGVILEDNLGEKEKAVQHYKRAAGQGNIRALYNLARCYYNGIGVKRNTRLGIEYYTKAAQAGEKLAAYNLAKLYDDGDKVKKDKNLAIYWYKIASDLGEADASYNLGYLYHWGGKNVKKNEQLAFKYYLKGAQQGEAESMYQVGLKYYFGSGVAKNLVLAKRWFEKAVNKGEKDACYFLGRIEEFYDNFDKALYWYSKADSLGDKAAHKELKEISRVFEKDKNLLQKEIDTLQVIDKFKYPDIFLIHALKTSDLAEQLGQMKTKDSLLSEVKLFINDSDFKSIDFAKKVKAISWEFVKAKNYEAAELLLNKAVVIYKSLDSIQHPYYFYTLNDLGSLYYYYNPQFEKALVYYQQVLKYYKTDKKYHYENYKEAATAYVWALYRTGKYSEAEREQKELIEACENEKDNIKIVINKKRTLGVIYEALGKFDLAEKNYQEFLTVMEATDRLEYSIALNDLGTLYKKNKLYDKSDSCYSLAIKVSKEYLDTDPGYYTLYLNNLSSLYLSKEVDKPDQAEPLLKEAIAIAEKNGKEYDPFYNYYLNNLGDTYDKQKRYKESLELYKACLDIRIEKYGIASDKLASVKNKIAVMYAKVNGMQEAISFLNQSIESDIKYVEQTFSLLSENEKFEIFKSISERFEFFNSFLCQHYKEFPQLSSDAYNYQIFIKSLFLKFADRTKGRVYNSGDTVLIKQYEYWLQQKNYVAKVLSLGNENIKKLNIDIKSILATQEQLEKDIAYKTKDSSSNIIKYTWKDIQAKIEKNEAAVEIIRFRGLNNDYTLNDSTVLYGALILTAETKDHPIFTIIGSANQLEKVEFPHYKNRIKFQIKDTMSYSHFWRPIEEQLKSKSKIFLCPEGIYHKINLNTIYKNSSKKYLLDEYDLRIVNNSSEIAFNSSQSNSIKNISLFGNPIFEDSTRNSSGTEVLPERSVLTFSDVVELPGTKVEVESIKDIIKNTIICNSYTEADASEENVKDITNANVLHFATHGFFLTDDDIINPFLRSGLLLTGCVSNNSTFNGEGQNREDGILTAMEVSGLSLDSTKIVVLSACESGLGEVKGSEGVYGLQRAFRIAGAKSIIMSLWTVDDEKTQALMVEFYRLLQSNSSPRKCFIEAQKLIKSKYPSPYYWGAFVFID